LEVAIRRHLVRLKSVLHALHVKPGPVPLGIAKWLVMDVDFKWDTA
jgi:hypothetical protein